MKSSSIGRWSVLVRRYLIIGGWCLVSLGSALAQDTYLPYQSCFQGLVAGGLKPETLPGTPSYKMRISQQLAGTLVLGSGATAEFWRVPCASGGKSATAVRFTPDALSPPSDAYSLQYVIVQGSTQRRGSIGFVSAGQSVNLVAPSTLTFQFPVAINGSSVDIDGDPDAAFTIRAFDFNNNLRGSVDIPAASGGGVSAIIPQVGLWWNPAESGSGYAIDYKHGVLVVTLYSYSASGGPQWYLASGPVTNNVFTATLDKYANGQCISCSYTGRPTFNNNDGTVTITFTSPTTAMMQLPGGRSFQIVPQDF